LVDIYLARRGDWRFEDVTEQAGVAAPNRFSTGVTFVDVDGDRDLDLLVTALGGPNALYVNDGAGRFEEKSEEVGLESRRGSMTASFADIEGDGDLDLFVSNYKVATVDDLFPPWEREFDRVVRPTDGGFEVAERFRDHYRASIREDLNVVVRTERADPDWLYLNDGTGRFESVPIASGRFHDSDGNPITAEPDYFVLSARFFDADGDLDPDLLVAADFEDPDFFWINDGTGMFREIPRLALRNTSNSAMALDFSDVDRDGDVDFFEVDMLSRDLRRRMTQRPSHTAQPKMIGAIDNRPQMMRNTLFLNRGDNTYAQVSYQAGIEASGWSWSAVFLDVDLDGYEDLLLSTGHIWDVMDSDIQERLRSSVPGPNWRRGRFLYPRLNLENVAFRNRGDLTFDEVSTDWGFGNEPDVSHGIALGDLDEDGDLDVVINRFESPAAMYRNDAGDPRLMVRLIGDEPNTQGVGAKIRVYGGAVEQQQKEVVVGGLYVSGSDPSYAFATGSAEHVRIDIEWRNGMRTVVDSAIPNRMYEIRQSAAVEPASAPQGSVGEASRSWFSDRSYLLRHRHHESPFDDYARQPLLSNSLAQLGPGVTWYDVDIDGDEDLLITSASRGAVTLLRNDGDRFTGVELRLPQLRYDQTTVLGLPASANGSALLIGQSGYEARTPQEITAAPAVLRVDLDGQNAGRISGASVSTVLPGSYNSIGPLALADYDGDADLDLFVGGRVRPGAYPIAASSLLLLNVDDVFEPDSANAGLLDSIGLVSGATFSDIDVDGDPDLLLAVEWGTIRLFLNDGGQFNEATSDYGFHQYASRWNGITTGDLNADGFPDVVATSWGRNTTRRPSSDLPLLLYYADYDRNGMLDLLEAQTDPERGDIYPLVPFSRIRAALPFVTRTIRTHMDYADATIQDLLESTGVESQVHAISTLDHVLFLSEEGSFSAVSLPAEAQFAPAFYAGIADFNGDGNEDLFLSQNFFPTELETPRYDAGRGLLLVGDGSGSLDPVPGQVSGIKVYGDQRGAAFADYDSDGRLDLVVSQNANDTKLYHNERAVPGLRVRLAGPPSNPHGIGALLRLVYQDGLGPVREVHGGTGYWSQNGPVQVMGKGGEITGVWVKWPGGVEAAAPASGNDLEVVVQWRRQD
jgi:hypothetical protein